MKKRSSILLSFFLVILCATAAYAEGEATHVASFANNFTNAVNNIGEQLGDCGRKIFWCLAIAQFFWNLYQLMLEGKFDGGGSLVQTMIKTLVTLACWEFIVRGAMPFLKEISDLLVNSLGNKPDSINSMLKMGFKVANAPFTCLIAYGKKKCGMFHPIEDLRFAGALVMMCFADFIILIAMVMAYITALITQAKLALVMSFALLAIGFSGSQYTRDIAINGIRSTMAVSVELLVIYTLMNVSESVFSQFLTYTVDSWDDVYYCAWECVIAAIVLSALYQQLPGVVSGMFGSGGGGGGNPLAGIAMAGAAVSMAKSAAQMAQSTATGAGKVAGKVGGGAIKAGGAIGRTTLGAATAVKSKGVLGATGEAVTNRFKSLSAAVQSAQDRGIRGLKKASIQGARSFLGRKQPKSGGKGKISS